MGKACIILSWLLHPITVSGKESGGERTGNGSETTGNQATELCDKVCRNFLQVLIRKSALKFLLEEKDWSLCEQTYHCAARTGL